MSFLKIKTEKESCNAIIKNLFPLLFVKFKTPANTPNLIMEAHELRCLSLEHFFALTSIERKQKMNNHRFLPFKKNIFLKIIYIFKYHVN